MSGFFAFRVKVQTRHRAKYRILIRREVGCYDSKSGVEVVPAAARTPVCRTRQAGTGIPTCPRQAERMERPADRREAVSPVDREPSRDSINSNAVPMSRRTLAGQSFQRPAYNVNPIGIVQHWFLVAEVDVDRSRHGVHVDRGLGRMQ